MPNQKNNRFNHLYALLPVIGLLFGPMGPVIGGCIAYAVLLLKKDISLAKNILYLSILMSFVLIILYLSTNIIGSIVQKTI